MVQAVQISASGIKCDAPGCDYNGDTANFEEYASYVNKPCPKCGANLFTEADFKAMNILMASAALVNATFGDLVDDGPIMKVGFDFDGTGKVKSKIIKDEPSRES